MAKKKENEAPSKREKYNPQDIEEFVTALDDEQTGPTDTRPPEPVARRVKVNAGGERSGKVPARKPVARSTRPDEVWGAGQPPADPSSLKKLEHHPRRGIPWGWIVTGFILLSGVAVAGYFFFNRTNQYSGDNVQLRIVTPKSVEAGEDTTFTIEYQNNEAVELNKTQLTVEYPTGFTFSKASVKSDNEFNNSFSLGTIKSGRAGVLEITGRFSGTVDTVMKFSATLSYRPANFSSDFQTTATMEATITTAALGLTIDGPKQLAPGASGQWTITYASTANRELANVLVAVTAPENFTLTASDPKTNGADLTWRMKTLAANSSGKIKITGTFSGQSGESAEFVARVGLTDEAGKILAQDEKNFLVALTSSGLSVATAINGQTESIHVTPGEALSYTVRLANRGDAEVNDIKVVLKTDGSLVTWTDAENPQQGVIKDQQITWSKKEVTTLTQLKPNEETTLLLTINTTIPAPVKNEADYNPTIKTTLTVTSPDLPADNALSKGVIVLAKIDTALKVTADARYYDDQGIALGSGPVPPKVGQTSAYRINWSVTNTTNEAGSFTATAVLPTNVYWTGKNVGRDAGDIAFDVAGRTVTWTINRVPPGTGTRFPTLNAWFEVSITPTVEQVGNIVVLTDQTTYAATDGSTQQKISGSVPSLTTDVPNDPQAGGEGLVQAS